MYSVTYLTGQALGNEQPGRRQHPNSRRYIRGSSKVDPNFSWSLKCRMFSGYLSIAVLGVFIIAVSAVHVNETHIKENSFLFYLCIFGIVGGLLMVGGSIAACSCCFIKRDYCPCLGSNRCADSPRGPGQEAPNLQTTGHDPPPYELSVNGLEPMQGYFMSGGSSDMPYTVPAFLSAEPSHLPWEVTVVKPPPYDFEIIEPPKYTSLGFCGDETSATTSSGLAEQTRNSSEGLEVTPYDSPEQPSVITQT